MGARARVGLRPGGRKAGRAGVGGACFRKGRGFEGAGFLETNDCLLLLTEN